MLPATCRFPFLWRIAIDDAIHQLDECLRYDKNEALHRR
jgi:hypothetical protein